MLFRSYTEQTFPDYEAYVAPQTFTIDLGSTELCKIATYQDKIYTDGTDWYVHKEIGKAVLDGSDDEGWEASTYDRVSASSNLGFIANGTIGYNKYYSNQLLNKNTESVDNSFNVSSFKFFVKATSKTTSISAWKTWLGSDNLIVYGALATPTDTKITNATLIGQLEAVLAMKLLLGTNNVDVSATSTNLPAILDVDYFTTWAKGGAVWEEGGPTGPTVLDVESIDNVYPIWEVTGPATNPQLTVLTTNTTIQYNGSVTSSQTLVIDMFNKTATLNGASVIGNVSGDWVDFKPGENKVTYTTDNADAPDSQIKWQEIVG